ncbi:peptidoglycan editing factor PgeF [Aquitalea sp.]|uniref:peptidoglycan editing factor PgeF n=1 Tax=Aquitalea sp. TaxID=1872623 RepID=UPI0025894E55|nr:peptidoglycan editing factor PgeF [Aquitalea sp.]
MSVTEPSSHWLQADWPAPANVRTLITTRQGGRSLQPFNSFNLGTHVGDDPEAVAANRELLRSQLPNEPAWLNQVHGTHVVNATEVGDSLLDADASYSVTAGTVCVVMTADCLPVLLCNDTGSVVAAAHAGWRGLCDGVLEASVAATGVEPSSLMAWLGPAIGPDAFEVGAEVRAAFMAADPAADQAFDAIGEDKYLADIYMLARQRLAALGIERVYGGDFCTVIDRERFFSYRRDKITGRMASLIWLQPQG